MLKNVNLELILHSALEQLLGCNVSQTSSLILSEDIDVALNDMDLIVHQIRQHQRCMRERRNNLAMTCQLPREVLAGIFKFCVPTSYTYQRPHIRSCHFLTFVGIGARLLSTIPPSGPDWTYRWGKCSLCKCSDERRVLRFPFLAISRTAQTGFCRNSRTHMPTL